MINVCKHANFKDLYDELSTHASSADSTQWSAVSRDVLNRCDRAKQIQAALNKAGSNISHFNKYDIDRVSIPSVILSRYRTAVCRLNKKPSCPTGLQTVTCSTVNCENENVVPVAAQPRKKEFAPLHASTSGFWTGGKHSRRSKRKHKKRTTRRRY